MLGALLIAGIFYLGGALFAGKLLKRRVKTWKALLTAFILLFLWTWLLHFAYEGNVPDIALSQVAFVCVTLFWGLRSKIFLPVDQKKKKLKTSLTGEAKQLYDEAFGLYKKGSFQEAIEKLKSANGIQPNKPIILMGLAYNHAKTNNFPEAIDYIERAVECGYKDFKKVQTHLDFTELRKTKQFQEFVKNGYKQTQKNWPNKAH